MNLMFDFKEMNHFYKMTGKILKYNNITPTIKNVFIAEGSKIIGNVEINEESSIWYNCVLRVMLII